MLYRHLKVHCEMRTITKSQKEKLTAEAQANMHKHRMEVWGGAMENTTAKEMLQIQAKQQRGLQGTLAVHS